MSVVTPTLLTTAWGLSLRDYYGSRDGIVFADYWFRPPHIECRHNDRIETMESLATLGVMAGAMLGAVAVAALGLKLIVAMLPTRAAK